MRREMKSGDVLVVEQPNGAGMTVRYLLPRPQRGPPGGGWDIIPGLSILQRSMDSDKPRGRGADQAKTPADFAAGVFFISAILRYRDDRT
jgi:hypothetical protein